MITPFLAPLLVLGWLALEQPREGRFTESAFGQLIQSSRGERVAVYGQGRARAWVYDLAGHLIGQLGSPTVGEPQPAAAAGTRLAPFVDHARVLYLAGRGPGPITLAFVGELPLAGGERQPLLYALPSPVPVAIDESNPLAFIGPEPLALSCSGARILLRVAGGWAVLELRAARAAASRQAPLQQGELPSGCRPMEYLGRRIPVPAPAAVFAEVWLHGEPHMLSAPVEPPGYLLLASAQRSLLRVVHPPRSVPRWGGALVAGRWVLFIAGACALGNVWLTLADLDDGAAQPNQWSRELPIGPLPGCHRRAAPKAWICGDAAVPTVEVDLPRGRAAWQLATGEPALALSPGEERRCVEMRPLRQHVAAWEAGRTLQEADLRFRVSNDPPALRASRGSTELWHQALAAPGYLLGLTDEDLLLVVPPAQLQVRARANGQLRRTLEVPSFDDALGQVASGCFWIGHVGRRAYWLVSSHRDWLHPLRAVSLAIFDGEQVTLQQ